MLEMIRRIFKIAGRSRQKIIVGITFNILKSFFNGFMMFGVFWILLHLENLTPTIILQAFGVVLGSVIGRFFFQWMYDRTMSGTGYDIFRDYRLEIGEKLKQAPMGYFSEQNLGTIQTILTTTIADLEGYSMLAIEQMTSGVAMAALMSIMMFFFNPIHGLPPVRSFGYDKTGQRKPSARSCQGVFGYLLCSRWRLRSHASSSLRMVSSIRWGV